MSTDNQQQVKLLKPKRQRLNPVEAPNECTLEICLYVKWCTDGGVTRIHRFELQPVAGVECLKVRL